MMHRKEFLQLLTAAALLPAVPAASQDRRRLTKNWAWLRADFGESVSWLPRFQRWRDAGIDAILPNTGDPEVLHNIIPVASEAGLEVHAWIFTMMRGGMQEEHPEWYAVNRHGESTADKPPYVEYYRFLCPNREPVQRHIADHVAQLGGVDGLAGIHLDYVRFPDVILPRALWSTYGLVQDRELPQFDYCYCDVCRDMFARQSGVDPLDDEAMPDPSTSVEWARFRHESITAVVNRLAEVARAAGKRITAAVFPTPTIARALVRQDWPRWSLDALLPMLYNGFYQEPVTWIEPSTREGVEALAGRCPLYAGLYVPDLAPTALATAARSALAGGAAGISVFEAQALTDEHWTRLAEVLRTRA